MSTPTNSFEDLRSILGKLDRKIDSARSRRLGLDPEPAAGVEEHGGPLIGKSEDPEETAVPLVDEAASESGEAVRRRSPYGRAKPLNRGVNGSGGGAGWLGGS